MHTMEEWKCSKCSYKVWRYRLHAEAKVSEVEYRHSIVSPDKDDTVCPGKLKRTGRERDGYVDESLTPAEYAGEFPRFGFRLPNWSKPGVNG